MEDLESNQLDLDQLDTVTGGTRPNYPYTGNVNTNGIRPGAVFGNIQVLNNMQSNITNKTLSPAKVQGSNAVMQANICPYCLIELKYIEEEDRYECTGCGFTKQPNQQKL